MHPRNDDDGTKRLRPTRSGVSVGMVDSNFRSVDEHGDTISCTRIVYKYSFYSPANEKMGFNIENNRTFNESQI